MTRTLKAPEVRRGEILDAAEALFGERGYEETSVAEILARAGIAKGTLYYYFKSKEEILDAVLSRYVGEQLAAMERAAAGSGSALERFARALSCTAPDERKRRLIETLHLPKNALMHQKSLVMVVKNYTPLFTSMVEQGIEEGVFWVASPRDTVEFMLTGMQFLLDDKIFGWTAAEQSERGMAFIRIAERLLGAAEGAFDFLRVYMQEEEA